MSKKMLAVINKGPHNYILEEIDIPIPKQNELLVKIEACGICGSDVHCYEGAPQFWEGDGPAVIAPPIIPGHEFVGVVAECGKDASEFFGVKNGDRVIAEQIIPCKSCMFCNTGKYWMCEVHNIYGFQVNGGMAEYMIFNKDSIVHHVPNELSIEDAAYIEPLSCGLHVLERANINFKDTVVVSGAGPLGLGMIQGAVLKTPKSLIVLDLDDNRLNIAKRLGADVILNPTKVNVKQHIKSLTSGYGCDIYIEATGAAPSANQGLEVIRRLGTFIEFSVFSSEVTADWSVIGDQKELNLLGSHLGPYNYPVAIDLLQKNKISAKDIVTHKFALKDFAEAIEVAQSLDSIKVLLMP